MMTGYPVLDIGLQVSTSDEFASEYLLAKLGSSAEQVTLCGAGEQAIGVLQIGKGADGALLDAGDPATIRVIGISKVYAGAAFSKGDHLTSDAAGKAVAQANAVDAVFGIALTAAAAADDIVDVLLTAGVEMGHYVRLQEKNTAIIAAGRGVHMDTGKITTAGAGEVAIGVAPAAIAQNAFGYVQVAGVAEVIADGNITENCHCKCDTTGMAATTTQGDYCLGIALEAASDGETFSMLIAPHLYCPAA